MRAKIVRMRVQDEEEDVAGEEMRAMSRL